MPIMVENPSEIKKNVSYWPEKETHKRAADKLVFLTATEPSSRRMATEREDQL